MTTQPSIESLREALALLTEPTGWQDRHEQARNLLAAALAELETLRAERDSLRAELATEKAKREEAEKRFDLSRLIAEDCLASLRTDLDAAEARNVELAARVEALEWSHRKILHLSELDPWIRKILSDALSSSASTPAADLAAHDAKVREPLEARIKHLESRICKTCEGLGVVHVGTGYASSDGGEDFREDDCPDCIGAIQRAATIPKLLAVVSLFQDVLDHPGDPYVMDRIKRWFDDDENEGATLLAARDARIRREALEAAAARVADRAWLIELPDSEAGYAVHFDLLNKVILSPAPDAASEES